MTNTNDTKRKPDPMEAAARNLAILNSIDPDSRVPNPDKPGKSQPAWCLYRQAARDAEKAARDAAAAESYSRIPAQPEAFQRPPLRVFGVHEQQTINQMNNCLTVGQTVAATLCADGHLGYAQPVGGVIAYHNQISVSGVGFDIGCGNYAVQLDTTYGQIKPHAAQILADIRANVSFGIGQINDIKNDHPLFDDSDAWRASGMEDYRQKARAQLGTVGSGNHYVDLMIDTTPIDDPEFGGTYEDCRVWIGVHFGSRGLGHTSATRYLKLAGGQDGINVPPTVLSLDSALGQSYYAAMELAGRYAYAGRESVVATVNKIIGGNIVDSIHNHHNYAWMENHPSYHPEPLCVVRKGATPAFPGQRGFVGGSMGDDAVIIEGVESADAAQSLYSTIHGAGRTMGRMAAKRTFTQAQMNEWLQSRNVLLSGGDIDESPMAYRRLPEVLAHQGNTIRVLHTLRPFAVAMAGAGIKDPFKD